jgi:FAD/FMN-containing dehydrogenase
LELTRDPDVREAHSRDASGLHLTADLVARPSDAAEVQEVVMEAIRLGISVTPAGSQTSMTGASITDAGLLMSLTAMKRILDIDVEERTARVEPGLTIGELNRALRETGLQFAPDPTSENDATIGGAIACNASGARTLRHGPTRRHVRAVTVVNADASAARYVRTTIEKNTVGFASIQDPVDWYVGSEGTLGVVVEAELALVPLPVNLVGLAVPFSDEASALRFVVAAREMRSRQPHCLEYFDDQALAIAGAAMRRPWDDGARAMIYLEDDAGEDPLDSLLDEWLSVAEENEAATADIRAFDTQQSLREAREFRHAVPATMNERGSAQTRHGGRKVSTDWSVPYRRLAEILEMSRGSCARHGAPPPVTYGHAGNGHPHQNFIAEDPAALDRIHAAISETLRQVVEMGGTYSAEHGVGKLKKGWLELQLSAQQIAVMRSIKQALDPNGLFSPGNIL